MSYQRWQVLLRSLPLTRIDAIALPTLFLNRGQAPQVLPLQESLLAIEQIKHNFKLEVGDSLTQQQEMSVCI